MSRRLDHLASIPHSIRDVAGNRPLTRPTQKKS
jgi:hypothetical protein